MGDIMIIIEELKILISKFKKDIKYYKNADKYNENNCRMEFIDPFFKSIALLVSSIVPEVSDVFKTTRQRPKKALRLFALKRSIDV